MAEKPKRLKKNISFSPHEKDIYDYLDTVENASALIKRLVYNHMIMEKGLVAPRVEVKDKNIKQETQEESDVTNEDETSVTVDETAETEETVDETAEEPKVETAFTKEDLETIELLPDL